MGSRGYGVVSIRVSAKAPYGQSLCDRCCMNLTNEGLYYRCLGCKDYNICLACACKGLYCLDDSHSWIRQTAHLGRSLDSGPEILPGAARVCGLPGKRYPSRFRTPQPTDTPKSLFADEHRFIRKSDPREILIYTDGSCLGNGQANPQAGCSFVFRPSSYDENGQLAHPGTISFRLEKLGPSGNFHKQTSNRAELRAVIGALMYRDWSMDCNKSWRSIVIATDSEYVAVNGTHRIMGWEATEWRLASQQPVKNQDLWKLLLKVVRQLSNNGVNVAFWRIPREFNERADKYAKLMAAKEDVARFCVPMPHGPKSVIFEEYEYDNSY